MCACVCKGVGISCNTRGNCIMLALGLGMGMDEWPALPTLAQTNLLARACCKHANTRKHTQTHANTHTHGPATSWHLSGHWHVLPCELVRRRRQCKHFINVTFPLWTEGKVTFYPWNGQPTTHTPATPCSANTHTRPWWSLSWSDVNLSPFVSSVFLAFMLHSWWWWEIREQERDAGCQRQDLNLMSQTCNSFLKVNFELCPSSHTLITNFNHMKHLECSPAVVNLLFETPVHVSRRPDLNVLLTVSYMLASLSIRTWGAKWWYILKATSLLWNFFLGTACHALFFCCLLRGQH